MAVITPSPTSTAATSPMKWPPVDDTPPHAFTGLHTHGFQVHSHEFQVYINGFEFFIHGFQVYLSLTVYVDKDRINPEKNEIEEQVGKNEG